MSGLFFAIGHEPATRFLGGQLELDEDGYIVTAPNSTASADISAKIVVPKGASRGLSVTFR